MQEYKTLQELFADPTRWTKGANARNFKGFSVSPIESEAKCFCLNGGFTKIYGYKHNGPLYLKLLIAIREMGHDHLASFNDSPITTIEDIQAVVKIANL